MKHLRVATVLKGTSIFERRCRHSNFKKNRAKHTKKGTQCDISSTQQLSLTPIFRQSSPYRAHVNHNILSCKKKKNLVRKDGDFTRESELIWCSMKSARLLTLQKLHFHARDGLTGFESVMLLQHSTGRIRFTKPFWSEGGGGGSTTFFYCY